MRRIHLKRRPSKRGQAGFTVTEVVVSLIITVQIILVALFMFDFNSRVTRAQTQLADLQQSQRVAQQEIARALRLAGRGRFPVTRTELPNDDKAVPPFGFAVDLINNAASDTKVAVNHAESPEAVDNTDILVVRGVMTNPVLTVRTSGSMVLNAAPATASTGTLTVERIAPNSVEQDLSSLNSTIDALLPEALLIISPAGQHAVVELDPASSSYTADQTVLAFKIIGGKADAYRDLWTNDSPSATAFPMENGASFVGVLEEYRFYIREELETSPLLDQDATRLAPRLSRARLFPNTGLPWGVPTATPAALNQALQEDIADGIFDLQVALGYDSLNLGQISGDTNNLGDDDRIMESADGTNDDWLFNAAADDETVAPWTPAVGVRPPQLHYLRISTLTRSTRPDWKYVADVIPGLEDRSYASDVTINSELARQYRRRTLQTTVDLRNL